MAKRVLRMRPLVETIHMLPLLALNYPSPLVLTVTYAILMFERRQLVSAGLLL